MYRHLPSLPRTPKHLAVESHTTDRTHADKRYASLYTLSIYIAATLSYDERTRIRVRPAPMKAPVWFMKADHRNHM